MFCHMCGSLVRDGEESCHLCGHRYEKNCGEPLDSDDMSHTSISNDTEYPTPKTRPKPKKDWSNILRTLDLIVDDPSISETAKIRVIINFTALTCAILAAQPIPFADFFVLTPIQVAMVTTMSRVMGMPVGKHGAGEVIASVAGVVGWGLMAQQTILGLYKTVIPYAGALTTIPLVYSATVGLGYAAKAILDARRSDQTITKEQVQKIRMEAENRAKSEKKDWSLNAIKEEYQNIISNMQEYSQYQSELKASKIQALKNELEKFAGEKESESSSGGY